MEPFDANKKILITGAAGFIGYHLARRLLSLGARVAGMDNMNAYYDVQLKKDRLARLELYPAFSFTQGDLADKETVDRIFGDFRPDIVVNLAAQAGVRYSIDHPREYIDSNIVGFFNILEACRHFQPEHLLFASSSSVYGNQKKTPFATTDNVDHPISLYAATKKSDELMAYTYCHLYGIPATGLRFFTVYGPFGRPDMAYFKFTNKIMKGEPITIFNQGDMYRDFTYVDDIVTGIQNMLCNPPKANEEGDRYKIYNIGNNHPEKLMTFIETLEKALAQVVGHPVKCTGAGRTDAGVHAERYVSNFRTTSTIPCDRLPLAVNSRLPGDIVVTKATEVPEDFNAIGSCIKKEYTYRIYNSRIRNAFLVNRVWFYPKQLDADVMDRAAQHFVGTHDFASVRSVGTETKTTVRTVHYFDIARDPKQPEMIVCRVCADGFLYNMVRAMVGTCVYASEGKLAPDDIPALLEGRNRTDAGPTAPPQGLYMTNLWYPIPDLP